MPETPGSGAYEQVLTSKGFFTLASRPWVTGLRPQAGSVAHTGQWSAALTSAGRHYLAHGTYPPRGSRPRKTQAAASTSWSCGCSVSSCPPPAPVVVAVAGIDGDLITNQQHRTRRTKR